MKPLFTLSVCLVVALVLESGCTERTQAESAAKNPAEAASAAGGSVASRTAPAANASAAPAATAANATLTPAGPAPASPAASPGAVSPEKVSPEVAYKTAQIQWALKEEEIKSDPNGQWAIRAKGSSANNDAQGTAPYAASQATGPGNVEGYGNNGSAWTPKTPDAGIEWLELQYARPVHATAVRVRETYGAGAIIKVELFDEAGTAHTVWSGADPTKDLNYLTVEFPRTSFNAARVKLTLATNVVHGWNEIDAVQLVGTGQ